jgi:hypothetical protein
MALFCVGTAGLFQIKFQKRRDCADDTTIYETMNECKSAAIDRPTRCGPQCPENRATDRVLL